MADAKPFLVPVIIDATNDQGAEVPDSFHAVQWTRLPAGEASPMFVERISRLLSPSPQVQASSGSVPALRQTTPSLSPPRRPMPVPLLIVLAVAVLGVGYFAVDRFLLVKRAAGTGQPPAETPVYQPAASATKETASRASPTAAGAAPFAPPPHSVAVLPFVNMSGDKEQEYFSDGLTEEILNSLARINELQVTARTSSFSFKGKDVKIGTIARELNVASVLEGSVRRSGRTVRITTQLADAVTGFQLWSDTYDRDLREVLKLQTEIATAVATALQVTLLGNVAAKSELGGTSNPAALDAYLRGRKASVSVQSGENLLGAVAAYTEAVRLDHDYALAFVARSLAFNDFAANWATGPEVKEGLRKAATDARRALALAPDLADAHLALAYFFESDLELRRADDEYSRAGALGPGNALFLQRYGLFTTQMGRTQAGLFALREAIRLDPVSAGPHGTYGYVLYLARQHEEAIAAYGREASFGPDRPETHALRGLAYYALGKAEAARSSCAGDSEDVDSLVCQAVTYEKLGRSADAKSTMAKFMRLRGEVDAYAYAEIYAQWGDASRALEWLEKAVRLRDTGLILLKTDPLVDPLRNEPRFQAAVRELRFPD